MTYFFSSPPLLRKIPGTKEVARIGGFSPEKPLRLQNLFVILQLQAWSFSAWLAVSLPS